MMARVADIEAEVTVRPLAAGGRTAARTGYRPQHRILPDYLSTGIHEYLDGDEVSPGTTARARIVFLTPEVYPHCLHLGQVLDIQEGDRVVGSAKITRILNRVLDRDLTPHEFAQAWGAERLVRLCPDMLTLPGVSTEAVGYLVEAGLPRHFVVAHPTLPTRISFGRLARGLTPLVAEPQVGPGVPPEWSPYVIVGDEQFDNGSAWYCIDRDTGHVVRVDPELDRPASLVNTTLPRFAMAMLLSISWSANVRALSPSWDAAVQLLAGLLSAQDPGILDVENGYWRKVVATVADMEPGAFRFLEVLP